MAKKPIYVVRVDPAAADALRDTLSELYRDFVSNMIGSTSIANLIGNTTPRAILRSHRVAVSFVVYDNNYPPLLFSRRRYVLKRA